MDEQMIELVRDAIDRNVTWQTGEVFKGNRQCVNYLEVATAAHSVMAGKVAELTGAATALLDKVDADRSVRWKFFNELQSLRAALAPYPERR